MATSETGQQVEDAGELLTAVAGLSPGIDALGGLRVRDTGLLGELGGLGLGLSDRAHEHPQGIADRLLNGVCLRAVEVKLLITVRTITPLRMSACTVSRTSS
jgi:hypothetical protein